MLQNLLEKVSTTRNPKSQRTYIPYLQEMCPRNGGQFFQEGRINQNQNREYAVNKCLLHCSQRIMRKQPELSSLARISEV